MFAPLAPQGRLAVGALVLALLALPLVLLLIRGAGASGLPGCGAGVGSASTGFLRSIIATMIAPITPAAISAYSHHLLFSLTGGAGPAGAFESSFS